MEYASKDLTIHKLRRTTDFKNLTFRIGGYTEHDQGRFYHLWKNGEVLSIQAEPYRRPGVDYSETWSSRNFSSDREAFYYLQEVLQTMLDNLKFGTENNWAHLVRQKDNTYSLIYTRKEFVRLKCPVWTKKVNLDDIEVTRIVDCALWEGIHEGTEVDLFIGVHAVWSKFVAAESLGHKLMNEAGVSHYTFKLLAHVYKSGMVIGVMCEPIIGRRVCPTDRAAVFAAVADIQRHGILLGSLVPHDILITPEGVRFLNISAVRFYKDHDQLAVEAQTSHWAELAKTFGSGMIAPHTPLGSRARNALSYVIPRLPSPGRPVYTTPELAVMQFVWSVMTSPGEFREQQRKVKSAITDDPKHRRRAKIGRKVLIAPLDCSESEGRFETLDQIVPAADEPYNPKWRSSPRTPYERPDKKLLLPRDDE
ncbi:hypothetical protein DFJ58DRAFT_806427 [Suillus subalutaceus]|uniref:uncharacterized protein n=1 Tax=Suillus subalutaceus TaxID=48586 RepID=UPI001B881912|nr:uncharacterized protein DFJ58DRAFT_806427 [Suillus subalutaceus]KAG1842394.1 hypothetical protein DFJ58DRAFT_806427 [Suillus subalutaceus]